MCGEFPLVSGVDLGKSRKILPLAGILLLAACAAPPVVDADPYESANRRVHGFNTGLDRHVLKPIADGPVGKVLSGPVGTGIDNATQNLGAPADVLNGVLQGRFENAVHNTWRFAINSTIGLAGIFDPATPMGLERRSTDFGATLHRWGAGEGDFVMLPVLGPSTERDTAGMIVDAVIDPLGFALEPREANAVRALKVVDKIGDRARFGKTVDSVLYESADSYAQLRLMYLQNRRHELGQGADDAFIDPYEESNGN